MGLIGLGIALVIVGLLLGLTGFLGIASIFQYIGWILLGIGVILAIVHYATAARHRRA